MMAKSCLYKRYRFSQDNRVSFSSALSESRRFLLRSLSLRSLASAVSESRQFFAACEDCAARLALSLPQRLDNRVSSAPSEARLIFILYLSLVVKMLQFYARVVVELQLRYVQRPLYIHLYIYIIEKSLPDVRLGPMCSLANKK